MSEYPTLLHSPAPSRKFFSGQNVKDASPKALPYQSFADFVNRWLSTPTLCHLTADEYAAADKAAKQAAKNGKYFCACTFTGDGTRKAHNFGTASLLVLDVDSAPDAQRVLSASINDLIPSNYCLWTTLTSTPESPRVRLIVDVDSLSAEQYREGVDYLGELFGIDVTPESRNVVQLWFAPTQFLDRQDVTPIVSSRVNGRPLPASTWAATPSEGDTLPLILPPAEDVTEDDVESMLAVLDPGMNYFDWVKVLCAVRHQLGDAGLDLFDSWSSKSEKYPGFDAIHAKWATFRSKTEKLVTIRSLIRMARDAGWQPSSARSFASLEAQIAAADLSALTGPVIKAVNDAPLLSPMEVELLVGRIKNRANALHAPVRASVIRTALKDLSAPTGASTAIPAELQGFVFVRETGCWVHPVKGVRFTVHGFDNGYSRLIPDGRPTVHALQVLGLGAVDKEGYEPSRPDELIYKDENGVEHLNTYRKSYPEADPATSALAGQIFTTHLEMLFPDATSRVVLLDWMSWILRHPGKKCRFAVFIQGAPGCGKSLIAEAFRTCFGSTNSRKVSNAMLGEKFNAWIPNTLFAFFEEVLIGDHQKVIMELLKDLITGETSNIRAMRMDAVERANMLNGMFLSNHLHGLRIDRDDRRFLILCCLQQHEWQVKAIPREHFAQLARLQTDLAGGFRHFLLNRPISPSFDPHGHAPTTADRDLVLRAGSSEIDAAVQAVIESGDHDLIAPDLLSSGELLNAVRGEIRHATGKMVARVLVDMGFTRLGQRSVEDGERHTLWFHPSLVGEPLEIFKLRWGAREV